MEEEAVPEQARLHKMCREMPKGNNPERWDPVRNWLKQLNVNLVYESVTFMGEYETTALHMACRHNPPVDVIEMLLTIAPDVVEWIDRFSWLSLHYACANGASEDVLRVLTNAFPPSKTAIDKRGRTPLHFLVGNEEHMPTPNAIKILSDSGAARCADENGSLPLHYACAYGANVEVLEILLDAVPASTTAVDFKGRTPLHFAMGNAEKSYAPAIVELLLQQNPAVVNDIDNDGQLPLQLLANEAKKIPLDGKAQERRDNTMKCLDHFLSVPVSIDASADFLNGLKNLPSWLLDHAVISEPVQKMLNEKIAQRFPTAILLLDGIFLIVIIIYFRLAIDEYLDVRYQNTAETRFQSYLYILYGGSAYYALREVIQILSLITLDTFSSWYIDFQNWLDVSRIAVTLVSAFIMQTQTSHIDNIDALRDFFAVTTVVLWVSMVFFLRATMIDFAVFVYGVIYIAQNLFAFLTALMIILFTFSQMLVTVYQNHDVCPDNLSNMRLQQLMFEKQVLVDDVFGDRIICDVEQTYTFVANRPGFVNTAAPSTANAAYPSFSPAYQDLNETHVECPLDGRSYCIDMYKSQYCGGSDDCNPFCDFWTGFLFVWIMLLGEVQEVYFVTDFAKVLYIIFGFSIVILLANVLIAIVTAYYGVVRNQRAEIVFWSNRLDFVAEMDAISTGVAKVNEFLFGCGGDGEDEIVMQEGFNRDSFTRQSFRVRGEVFGFSQWRDMIELFEPTDASYASIEFWCILFTRLAVVVIIPIWLLLGLATAGWLWPPQVREWCFVAKFTNASVKSQDKFEKNTLQTMKDLQHENEKFSNDIKGMADALKLFVEYQS